MKQKTRSTLQLILICMVCTIPITGCGKKVVSESAPQAAATEQNKQAKIVSLIEQGQRDFLFHLEDGYSYPVKVIKPVFIETMPLKIKVRLLHQQRDAAVPVEMLESERILPDETAPVEVYHNNKWQQLDMTNIRVKGIKREGK